MKLIFCEQCFDVVKLDREMRQCKCGRVKGRYIDEVHAEVSPEAVSVYMAEASLEQAIAQMHRTKQICDNTMQSDHYANAAPIVKVFVRPNTGCGNPHTTLIEE